ncbi:translation initiation factor IF-3 [Patescibacteria group bacterium]
MAAQKESLINEQIKAEKLRVIDAKGEQLGVLTLEEALAKAKEKELDLVEVSPQADPPVARLVDYTKLKYQQQRQATKHKAKQKKIQIKGVRISMRIGQHDMELRAKQADKFFKEGHKVKIEMVLHGRERDPARRKLVMAKIEEFRATIKTPNKIEQPPSNAGNRVYTIINREK